MPGPVRIYYPALPEDLLQEAERVARCKTTSHQRVQRSQLVLLLHRDPRRDDAEAGRHVGLSGRQVRRWRTRWAAGACSLVDLSGRGRQADFPPLDHALVKAVACERVADTEQPLSRQSVGDVRARVQSALGKPMSRSTVWRMLSQEAIKPWHYRSWIFPRDPQFAEKAGPSLDLYAGLWQGQPLGPKDHLLSADEKTSIQARSRCPPSLPPAPRAPPAHRARIRARWGAAIPGRLGCAPGVRHGTV